MLDRAFQPAESQHGTHPAHHGNALCGPARRHFFRSDVPNVHITFTRAQRHELGGIVTGALDDTQVPMTFLKLTKLTHIFTGGQVFIMHSVSPVEKKNIVGRAAEEGQRRDGHIRGRWGIIQRYFRVAEVVLC